MEQTSDKCELTILLPCLNEAETIAICIEKAKSYLEHHGVSGEVLIADNGSSDGSQRIAVKHGARVVDVPMCGYGAALMGGIEAARGRYVIMGDADDSYDFTALEPFVEKLRQGFELVMGNRFKGGIKPGAMPPLHKYLGNPVLSGIGRIFFKSPIGDFHCGLRGFDRAALLSLNLQTTGMEFASEMVVRATLCGLKIAEVPTTLSPDQRSRPPHLRSWRDGWRHLRFLLVYSPRWLFFYPGFFLTFIGLCGMLWLLPGPQVVLGATLNIHSMLYASAAILLGLQSMSFAAFSKIFGVGIHILPKDDRIATALRVFTLERGLVLGFSLILFGLVGSIYAVTVWGSASFGPLSPDSMMRIAIPSITSLTAGAQIVFSSFFLSLLGLAHK
jgi:glycosyltransferase involved in cell wall biosynthesis